MFSDYQQKQLEEMEEEGVDIDKFLRDQDEVEEERITNEK